MRVAEHLTCRSRDVSSFDRGLPSSERIRCLVAYLEDSKMTSNAILKKITGFVGIATLAALLVSIPGLAQAQMSPRPNPASIPSQPSTGAPNALPATPRTSPTSPGLSSPSASSRTQFSSLDREFMLMAAHSDNFEIKSSQLALQKSSNPEVKQYAQKMIDEHTQSTNQLKQIAAQKNVSLPTDPGSFNQAVIDQLTLLTGTDFDRAYLEAQANGHMQTVAVFRTESGQGKDAALKQFAAQLLPTIEGHYTMASQLTGQRNALSMPGSTRMTPSTPAMPNMSTP